MYNSVGGQLLHRVGIGGAKAVCADVDDDIRVHGDKILQRQAVAALVQNIFGVQGIQHTTAHLGIEGHEGAIGVASHEQNLQGFATLAADLVHQRIDSLLKLIGVRVSGLLHVEDLADVPHILYNVIQ